MSEFSKISKISAIRDLKATISLSGITENLIAEITDQLSTKSIVKIKINRGLFQKTMKNVWTHLAVSTNSTWFHQSNVGVLETLAFSYTMLKDSLQLTV